MDLDLPANALAEALRAARTAEQLDAAIDHVARVAGRFREPELYGRMLYASEVDAAVPVLAQRLKLKDLPGELSNTRAVVLVSRLYASGGHSRVAADIVRRLPPASATLVMTDPKRQFRHRQMLNGVPGFDLRAAVLLASATPAERIVELYNILAAIRPTRIFLLNHHMDLTAVAAAWPFRDVVEFIHHADHLPCLGATLPFAAHVDLTWTCHLACRDAGLRPLYAGLAAPALAPGEVAARPGLRVATSGVQHKFEGRRAHAWADFAAAVLRRPGAEMIHIGATSPEFEQGLRQALAGAGADPARYRFVGQVESVHAALLEHGADVYLSSFPETGGKANLEAMAARIPVILPMAAGTPPLLRYDLPLRRWTEVERPDQIDAALDAALAMAPALRTPEAVAELERELGRFDAYVANEAARP